MVLCHFQEASLSSANNLTCGGRRTRLKPCGGGIFVQGPSIAGWKSASWGSTGTVAAALHFAIGRIRSASETLLSGHPDFGTRKGPRTERGDGNVAVVGFRGFRGTVRWFQAPSASSQFTFGTNFGRGSCGRSSISAAPESLGLEFLL
ncbi:unnamed protein product [Ixodes pacificus]